MISANPLSLLSTWFAGRRRNAVRRKEAAHGFDVGWLRWAVSVLALASITNLFSIIPGVMRIATIANGALGMLLLCYFGHLLLRRLQCSLLEFCVLIAMLGNMLGWLVTIPGISGNPPALVSASALLSAWVLYGAVMGLTHARLLAADRQLARLALMAFVWLSTAAPVLIFVSATIWFFKNTGKGLLVSPDIERWALPFFVVGLCGLVLRLVMTIVTVRSARRILGETAASKGSP